MMIEYTSNSITIQSIGSYADFKDHWCDELIPFSDICDHLND